MGLGSTKMKRSIEGFKEGGVKVDPISGNEVPLGSLPNEVRDDVDAKLSEGEFVFPADVVRFVGLDKLMKIREEAKKGLERMSNIGQMGNAEEAPEVGEEYEDEEDKNFTSTIDEILGGMEEGERKFAQGGVVQEDAAAPPADAAMAPPADAPSAPSGASTMGAGLAEGVNAITVVNMEGDELIIPVINNMPLMPIPEGYEIESKNKGYKLNDKGRAIPDSIDPDTADAIAELLSALTKKKEVGQKAREYVQSFNADNIKKAVAANLA